MITVYSRVTTKGLTIMITSKKMKTRAALSKQERDQGGNTAPQGVYGLCI